MNEIMFNFKCVGKKRDVKKVKKSVVEYFLEIIREHLKIPKKELYLSDPNYLVIFEKSENDGSKTVYKIEDISTKLDKDENNESTFYISFKTYSFSFELIREFFEFISLKNPSIEIFGSLKSNENELFSINVETKDNIIILHEPELNPETNEYVLVEILYDPIQKKYLGIREV